MFVLSQGEALCASSQILTVPTNSHGFPHRGGGLVIYSAWHEEVVAAMDVAAEARLREVARSRRGIKVVCPIG